MFSSRIRRTGPRRLDLLLFRPVVRRDSGTRWRPATESISIPWLVFYFHDLTSVSLRPSVLCLNTGRSATLARRYDPRPLSTGSFSWAGTWSSRGRQRKPPLRGQVRGVPSTSHSLAAARNRKDRDVGSMLAELQRCWPVGGWR
jgi:hypothetical protein